MDPQLKGSLDSENIQRYPKNRRKEPETARCAYIYDMVDQVDADLKMFTLNVWMDIWLCLVAVPQWWKVWLQSGYTWQGYYWEGPLSRFLWWAFWWWSTFWRTKEFRKEGRWRWPLHRLMEEHRVWSLTRLGEGDLFLRTFRQKRTWIFRVSLTLLTFRAFLFLLFLNFLPFPQSSSSVSSTIAWFLNLVDPSLLKVIARCLRLEVFAVLRLFHSTLVTYRIWLKNRYVSVTFSLCFYPHDLWFPEALLSCFFHWTFVSLSASFPPGRR